MPGWIDGGVQPARMAGAPRKESTMDDVRDQDAVTETEEILEVDDLLVEEVSIDGMCGVY